MELSQSQIRGTRAEVLFDCHATLGLVVRCDASSAWGELGDLRAIRR